jgi:hypothetical protein
MKLLMDADCLIKLTKAGLKETVCRNDTVFIPLYTALNYQNGGITLREAADVLDSLNRFQH